MHIDFREIFGCEISNIKYSQNRHLYYIYKKYYVLTKLSHFFLKLFIDAGRELVINIISNIILIIIIDL